MSLGVQIDLRDAVSENLALLIEGLDDRTELHQYIAHEAFLLTREHIQKLADTRHKTAEELGADPTGFWRDAVERVTDSADGRAATVNIFSPGISRVDHEVTITPSDGHEFLTLPVHPLAYGHRASELARDMDIFVIHVGSQIVLATKEPGQKIATTLYLLLPEVTLPQDRTLLPEDEEYEIAAAEGIDAYVDKLFAAKEAA